MPINPKVFVAVTALTGGCVGLPLYFLKTSGTSRTTVRPSFQATVPAVESSSVNVSQDPKSVSNGECEITELTEDIKEFLGDQYKNRRDYVSASCKNTSVKSDYAPLPTGWLGWFPDFVFSNEASKLMGKKFELKTETKQEDGDLGSYTEVTFSGKGLSSTFSGKWDEQEKKTKLNKSVVTVQVSGEGNKRGLIYLFLS